MSEVDESLYDHIKAIARRLSCNSQDTEDLAHDAIVRVMEQEEDRPDKEGNFKAWASIVAANHIINILKRESNRAEVESLWANDQYAIDQDRLQRWLSSDRTEPHPVNGKDTA